ncbi:MAG: EpsI family protein [Deltaproteobacteria bacterium]|nr:MAG: EpsI family protein [Deltaproteobacteria bacterium]
MRAERLATFALGAAVVAVGALAWWLQTRPALVVDASPLAGLPRSAGAWHSVELPLASAVESILRADFNLQRAYYDSAYYDSAGASPVWLYIGYYGTARGGRPEHIPRGCYTGAGWDIESARVIDAGDGSGRRMTEYRVARNGDRQLVHYWYRSSRRTGMVGGVDQRLDQILGRLLQGRADGALIRLSTTLGPSDESQARARLFALGRELEGQLAQHWPAEHPRS